MTTDDDRMAVDRRALLGAGAGAIATLAGCLTSPGGSGGSDGTTAGGTGPTTDGQTDGTTDPSGMDGGATTAEPDATTPTNAAGDAAWRSMELTDVTTGETFTIAGFEGRPVLVEFFAVWCPVCTHQQEAMQSVVTGDDDIVAISLNVDPNEDAGTVRQHVEEHGFDWRYAISPAEVTSSLVDAFGGVVTTPPAAPVVRVCPDGRASLVEGRGVKDENALRTALDRC